MRFDYNLILTKLPDILTALAVTVAVWLISLVGAAALGFLVALGRRYGPRWLNAALLGYVELFRGTPFLVQLFLLYFGGPYIGLSLDAEPAGVIGLSVYGGAYFSEVFRLGFEAVPRGHVEAAECSGFTRAQIVRRIMIPEMAVLTLPAVTNLAVSLLKDTAILSLITVQELTFTVQAIGTEFYAFVETLFLLALGYWGLVEITAALGRLAESRLARYRFA